MNNALEPPASPWYRPNLADLLFLCFILPILAHAHHQGLLDDPGLGWHLRTADAMWSQKGFVYTDPFSLDAVGRPWVTYHLGDVLFRLGYAWAGLEGLAVITALVLAFTLRCLYCYQRVDGIAWPLAAFWTFMAALGLSSSWVTRPNIFTILLLVVTVRMLDRFHETKLAARTLFWLVPLFALWVNLHGGFVAGLAMIGLALLVEIGTAILVLEPDQRRAAGRRSVWLSGLLVSCLAATLVNPYGWRVYAWIHEALGSPFIHRINAEYASLNFHDLGAFRIELLLLFFVTLLAVSRYRVNAFAFLTSLLWLHLGLNSRRFAPLWALLVTPVLARLSADVPRLNAAWNWLAGRLSAGLRELLEMKPAADRPWISLLFACGLLVGAPWLPAFAHHEPTNLPTQALTKVIEISQAGPTAPIVFHSPNWGGYLTWHGWLGKPRLLTWLDDRNELHGEARYLEYFAMVKAENGWQDRLKNLQVAVVCVPADCGLACRLAEDPGWQRVYADKYAVVYQRTLPASATGP